MKINILIKTLEELNKYNDSITNHLRVELKAQNCLNHLDMTSTQIIIAQLIELANVYMDSYKLENHARQIAYYCIKSKVTSTDLNTIKSVLTKTLQFYFGHIWSGEFENTWITFLLNVENKITANLDSPTFRQISEGFIEKESSPQSTDHGQTHEC